MCVIHSYVSFLMSPRSFLIINQPFTTAKPCTIRTQDWCCWEWASVHLYLYNNLPSPATTVIYHITNVCISDSFILIEKNCAFYKKIRVTPNF